MLERRDDASDRRAKLLYLTTEGRKRAQHLEEALIPFRRNLFRQIDKDDIAAFKRVLDALGSAIESSTP